MTRLAETDIDKIIRKFRSVCIKCWTSDEYKIPPDSKEIAQFKAMEVCLFLRGVLEEMK